MNAYNSIIKFGKAQLNTNQNGEEMICFYPNLLKKGIEDTQFNTQSHPLKTLTDEEIIEGLAELEHDQWMSWADSIMKSEKISDNIFARWASLMIPYSELSEEMKEYDRVWARKALAILRKAGEK